MTPQSKSNGVKDKEIPPAVFIGVIVFLVVVVVGWFSLTQFRSVTPLKVSQLDPKDLADEDPPKRGQPGYRERTTDPPR